jgi:WD repeat-containing protein 45
MNKVFFNQDNSCFGLIVKDGFIIYNTNPVKERYRRVGLGDLSLLQMLFKTNLIFFSGTANNKVYLPNKLYLWDDNKGSVIADLTFDTNVVSIKARRDVILISTITHTYLYNMVDLKLLKTYDTGVNTKGLSGISYGTAITIVVPSSEYGQILIDHYDISKQHIIICHSNALAKITLSVDGSKVVTASERGTIIRVWDTYSCNKLHEFRRGLEVVAIYDIIMNKDANQLLVISEKGTIHLYYLHLENVKSILPFKEYLPDYFKSEWSISNIQMDPRSVLGFDHKEDFVYIVSTTNYFLKYKINKNKIYCVETFQLHTI